MKTAKGVTVDLGELVGELVARFKLARRNARKCPADAADWRRVAEEYIWCARCIGARAGVYRSLSSRLRGGVK